MQREKNVLPGESSGPRTATIAFIRRPSSCLRSANPFSSAKRISMARKSVAYISQRRKDKHNKKKNTLINVDRGLLDAILNNKKKNSQLLEIKIMDFISIAC